jgi:hypothetical protein
MKTVRIMTESKSRTSCSPLFHTLAILTLPFPCILHWMIFLIKNLEHSTFNSSVHNIHTRRRLWLHRPVVNLISYQKGVCYASIKTFKVLPVSIAELITNKKHFIAALKTFIIDKSLCSNNEYFK